MLCEKVDKSDLPFFLAAIEGQSYIASEKLDGHRLRLLYKDGKVTIDVTDAELEKILKEPFTATSGEVRDHPGAGKIFINKVVIVEPGTREHLSAVAQEIQGYDTVISHEE